MCVKKSTKILHLFAYVRFFLYLCAKIQITTKILFIGHHIHYHG